MSGAGGGGGGGGSCRRPLQRFYWRTLTGTPTSDTIVSEHLAATAAVSTRASHRLQFCG